MLTDEDLQGPYNPNPVQPPAAAPVVPPEQQSAVGQAIREHLPVSPEVRNWLALESPSWGDIASGANKRVNYLYDRLQRGISGDKSPLPPMDIPTRALGSIMQGAGEDPILYAIPQLRYATMAGNLLDEFGQGIPPEQRNLYAGASMFINPRTAITSMLHSPLAHFGGNLMGPVGRAVGAAIHSPKAILDALLTRANWARAIVAGHEAGRDSPPANQLNGAGP